MARNSFQPSAPNQVLWIIAVVMGLLGILSTFVPMDVITANSFWMVAIAFILLAIGTSFKGI